MTGTERKVFQKYYPPDFDPTKLKKEKRKKKTSFQFVQRVMAPFNMQCNTCSEYIYKGRKFNMRRETAMGEDYLGLKIFRFYFRCPNCLADISFKTDIENVDYSMEHGATRLFEAFKYYQEQEKKKEEKEEAEKNDAMKMLEKRTKMSRAEMEAMGKLEKLQEVNKRLQGTDTLGYLANLEEETKMTLAEKLRMQEEEDEREVQRIMSSRNAKNTESTSEDECISDEDVQKSTAISSTAPSSSKSLYKSAIFAKPLKTPLLSGVVVKKSRLGDNVPKKSTTTVSTQQRSILPLADYGSDSDEL